MRVPWFRRLRDEEDDDEVLVRVVLGEREASVLAGLPDQMKEVIERGEGSIHDRLFPSAYLDPTEEAAEREWQRLMHDDLLRTKLSALEIFRTTLSRAQGPEAGDDRDDEGQVVVVLDDEEVAAWLGTLNDIRLTLGVMLEVTEDLDLNAIAPSDPRAPAFHLYGLLTWIQDELIDALGE